MKKAVLVGYATRHGHTRRLANHIANLLSSRGLIPELMDVGDAPEDLDVSRFSSGILAASVHMGRHEKEMVSFVERHREELEAIPAAFLSVSLAEASAEDESGTSDQRVTAARAVAQAMDKFFDRTGWHPARTSPVAGALLYSKYNVLIRWVMKQIARSEGASADVTHDHIYTDWEALDDFVDEFARQLPGYREPGLGAGELRPRH